MKISLAIPRPLRAHRAFSMIEILLASAILGVMFVSLYGGMSSGFAVTRLARENLRATQIMLERLEGIRLYNWNQLCYSNMVPATFSTYYYPALTNASGKGISYQGTISVAAPDLNPSATYADRMRAITVTIYWTNDNGASPLVHRRRMTTYSARDGVQNYVYRNGS